MNRPLTSAEDQLVRWMLEHGKPEARAFLSQLERAQVTDWHCPCGCASINFAVDRFPEPSGGHHAIADFIFGGDEGLSGIFVFEQAGILAGLEVYGLAGDAPKTLPSTDSLRPFSDAPRSASHGGQKSSFEDDDRQAIGAPAANRTRIRGLEIRCSIHLSYGSL